MNLLLVEPNEVHDGIVVVEGRRAAHLRDVLHVTVGQRVKAGIVGGGIGIAEVLDDKISLRLEITAPRSVPLPLHLILALPRPKVLTRTIEAAASFGVERMDLTNAWRVDKSYLDSPRLDPAELAEAVRLGAEQGATTYLPEVTLHRRLMPLLDGFPVSRRCVIAHPTGVPIETVVDASPLTLAIGPEGGWIQRELDTFVERGFVAVSLGAPILRVETAVAALLGQIVLLRRQRVERVEHQP